MKTTNYKLFLFCILNAFFFLNTNTLSAQWQYQSSSLWNSIYRYGNVGIGGYPYYKFDVKGTIRCYNLNTTSDKRYKKNINNITSALNNINELQGVTYEFDMSKQKNGESFPKGKNIGLIAQDVNKVLPELVLKDDKGIYSVNYIGIIPILIEATKELNEKLVDKEKQLSLFEERIKKLEQRILSVNQHDNIENNDGYRLEQNIPNPAKNNTLIKYKTPLGEKNISVKIFSTNGRQVWQKEVKPSLSGEVIIPTNNLKEGVYIYSLTVGDKIIISKKLVIN